VAAGGVATAWEALQITAASADSNAYALTYGGGPWFRYVVDLVLLSPGTVLLYLVWLGMLLERRERDDRQWAWALVPILMVALLALMTKNVRYALCLELPIRLGAVLALQRLISLRPSLQGWRCDAVLALGVAVLMWADVGTFLRLFVVGGIYDPVSAFLLQGQGILPP